jgi:hypothetical protein
MELIRNPGVHFNPPPFEPTLIPPEMAVENVATSRSLVRVSLLLGSQFFCAASGTGVRLGASLDLFN